MTRKDAVESDSSEEIIEDILSNGKNNCLQQPVVSEKPSKKQAKSGKAREVTSKQIAPVLQPEVTHSAYFQQNGTVEAKADPIVDKKAIKVAKQEFQVSLL